ncbi:MAG: phosphatidate cytidylyltransferase [Rhizobiales bacterium]|nr:phosphatidate cytidylyltransferase [Hyphomicrobiales bacterium]
MTEGPGRNGAPSTKWQDLGIRTLSAAVLIPIVLLDVWLGGAWYEIFVLLIGILIAREWVRLSHDDADLQFALHVVAVLAAGILPFGPGFWAAAGVVAVAWAISLALGRVAGRSAVWPYVGIPYAAAATMALMVLGTDHAYGALSIIWLMAVIWAADSLAYFAGRTIGGPRLAPILSPKKTWAGLGGAIAGGILAALAVGLAAGLGSLAVLALLGGILAVVGQAGDLFKSALKRSYGVKDAGHLIPGHGGVLDRVDGLVAAAMVAALIGSLHSGHSAAGFGLLNW